VSGLRYVSDQDPGILRRPAGKGFRYVDASGHAIKDRDQLKRIQQLVIPPAWRDVWICSCETGHLQAVGRDARGRKQYRYHQRYRAVRDQTKFSRMIAFSEALPAIRARVTEDLNGQGLSKQRVLALLVRLLDATAIRIGNEEYARDNESFGLTTLRSDHVEINSQTVQFNFRGKSGQAQTLKLTDRRMARIVRQCQNLPGQELFHYLDEAGESIKISSEDVNAYLHDMVADDFTAKDFRTWKGTAEMVAVLEALGPAENETDAKRKIVEAVKQTAQKLGNRPATCRAYYIHPAVTDAYLKGTFFEALPRAQQADPNSTKLTREERIAVDLIRKHTASDLPPAK